jgi:hypothetical protein
MHTVTFSETEIWDATLTSVLAESCLGYKVNMTFKIHVYDLSERNYYEVTFQRPEDETMFRLCCLTPKRFRTPAIVSPIHINIPT